MRRYVMPVCRVYVVRPTILCEPSTVEVTFDTTVDSQWDGVTHDVEMARKQSSDVWSTTIEW